MSKLCVQPIFLPGIPVEIFAMRAEQSDIPRDAEVVVALAAPGVGALLQ
jgi:hypothetical protein